MPRPSKEAKELENFYMSVLGKILAISKKHSQAVTRYVEKNDIQRSQHQLLITLSYMLEDGQPVSQRDLAENLNVTPAAVAVTLKKLEKSGVVEKKVSDRDNRFNEVIITEKGMKIVKESQRLFHSIDQQAFKDFSKEELDQLVSYAERILLNLDPYLEA